MPEGECMGNFFPFLFRESFDEWCIWMNMETYFALSSVGVCCSPQILLWNWGYNCLNFGYPLSYLGYSLCQSRLPIVSNWATLGYQGLYELELHRASNRAWNHKSCITCDEMHMDIVDISLVDSCISSDQRYIEYVCVHFVAGIVVPWLISA